MKLGKNKLIIVILAVMIIGAIWSGMTLTQQAQEQQELKRNILLVQQKTAQINLDELAARNDQLMMDKAQYITQKVETGTKLSSLVDDISATDLILESAHSYNLEILGLTTGGETDGTMAGNKFTTLPLNYHVKGNLADIAGFISNIKNVFPTSEVQLYNLKIGGDAPSESPEIVLAPSYTDTTIKIIIYDYKGEANVE